MNKEESIIQDFQGCIDRHTSLFSTFAFTSSGKEEFNNVMETFIFRAEQESNWAFASLLEELKANMKARDKKATFNFYCGVKEKFGVSLNIPLYVKESPKDTNLYYTGHRPTQPYLFTVDPQGRHFPIVDPHDGSTRYAPHFNGPSIGSPFG